MENNFPQQDIEFLCYVVTIEVGGHTWRRSRQCKNGSGICSKNDLGHLLAKPTTIAISVHIFLRFVGFCLICLGKCYHKGAMNFVSKLLWDSSTSCLSQLCLSTRIFISLLKCKRREWLCHWQMLMYDWMPWYMREKTQWLLNESTNSWEKTLCRSVLIGVVATLFGVAQNQRVYGDVCLRSIEIQTQMST